MNRKENMLECGGTSFNLESGEIAKVKELFKSLNINIRLMKPDEDVLMFLRRRDFLHL